MSRDWLRAGLWALAVAGAFADVMYFHGRVGHLTTFGVIAALIAQSERRRGTEKRRERLRMLADGGTLSATAHVRSAVAGLRGQQQVTASEVCALRDSVRKLWALMGRAHEEVGLPGPEGEGTHPMPRLRAVGDDPR